jgi:hypothetical protein
MVWYFQVRPEPTKGSPSLTLNTKSLSDLFIKKEEKSFDNICHQLDLQKSHVTDLNEKSKMLETINKRIDNLGPIL